MSADLCFTRDSFFFFVSYPRSSTTSGHLAGSMCSLKMHVWNVGYPFPLQIGGPKTSFFPRFRNLKANFMKHDIDKPVNALQTTRGLIHRLKSTWTLVHKQLQIGSELSPTVRKFCIPLHYQTSQTEISKRNSTKLCQTMDSKSR